MKNRVAYTIVQGRAGDHNDLGMSGAAAIGRALARRTGLKLAILGEPQPFLDVGWREELDAA